MKHPPAKIAPVLFPLGILTASILLILSVPIPALDDYPNHLARVMLIANLSQGTPNPFVILNNHFTPNLAVDLIAPFLARIIDITLAVKLFLICSKIMLVAGAILFERVIKGRSDLAPFIAPACLFLGPLDRGLLNFEFGIGFMLVLLSMTWSLMRQRTSFAIWVTLASVAVLTTIHIIALSLYLFVIVLLLIDDLISKNRLPTRLMYVSERIRSVMRSPRLVFWMMLAFVIILQNAIGGGLYPVAVWLFKDKIYQAMTVFSHQYYALSVAGVAIVCVTIVYLFRRQHVCIRSGSHCVAYGMVSLFLLAPFYLIGGTFFDGRLLLVTLLISPAMLDGHAVGILIVRRLAAGLAIGSFLLTTYVWVSFIGPYRAVDDVIARLPQNAIVMVATDDSDQSSVYKKGIKGYLYQSAVLAMPKRNALLPHFFAYRDQHSVILNVDDAFIKLTRTIQFPVLFSRLKAVALQNQIDHNDALSCWPKRFSVLLLFHPQTNPMPEWLQLISGNEIVAAYSVRSDGICSDEPM